MLGDELTPELMRIMTEDANDLSNSLWESLRAYDNDNKTFVGRHEVLLNSLTTVTANVLKQLGNEDNLSELCAAFLYEILMKLNILRYKGNNDGTEQKP